MSSFVCPECGAAYPSDGSCSADGARLLPAADSLVGTLVGSYRIARVIGQGGMGRVYLGVHPQIQSRVAVKVLSEECSRDKNLVDRFVAEARAVNVIRNEGIVSVVDINALSDGRPYIVMEHLEGESLGELLRRGALPLGTLSRVMNDVLRGLSAAHEKGIIHRDLKPDNIFVTRTGRAKILDFGIAKLLPELGAMDEATRTGSVLGTPFYMAPEQALGRPVDPRSDLYALGVILYECSTGRRPFHGNTLYELLKQHVEVEPPPPSSMRTDLPPAYEAVIRRAMAKNPAERFQSALELSHALENAARDLPQSSYAPAGTPVSAYTPAPSQSWNTPPGAVWSPPPRHGYPGGPAYPGPQPALSPVQPPPVGPKKASRAPLFFLAGCGLFLMLSAAAGAVILIAGRSASRSASIASDPGPLPTQAVAQEDEAPDDDSSTGSFGLGFGQRAVSGFDAKHFDVQRFLPEAERLAREHYRDAEMIALDVQGSNPDGIVDFSVQSGSTVLYRFRSPSHSEPPPTFPKNATFESNCLVYVMVGENGVTSHVVDRWACDAPITRIPRCTVKDIWRKAIERGAPAGNVIGSLGFNGEIGRSAGKLRWYVNIPPSFSNVIDDDC